MSTHAVFDALKTCSNFPDKPFADVLLFIRLCCMALPHVKHFQKDLRLPLDTPPRDVGAILASALSWNLTTVNTYWGIFKKIVYDHPKIVATEDDIVLYNRHALSRKTSYRHMHCPVRTCQKNDCVNYRSDETILTLAEPVSHKATLFTLSEGAIPIYTTSLYCRGCNRRYYHNYYVHKQSSTRTYYGGVPDELQVAEHYFVESSLLEFFANGMVFGWLSGTNCARIYNHCFSVRNAHIINNKLAFPSFHAEYIEPNAAAWQTSLSLRPDDVMNGFFLYSLLLDKAERRSILILSHNETSQRDRLQHALAERNKAMEGIGQENYPHACDLCFVAKEGPDGQTYKMQAAVCDGDTIGHPCCAVHDCKVPLASHHHRFCPDHSSLNEICAVTTCELPIAAGFRTCADPAHRALEKRYFSRGEAFFQLRSKLKKAGVAVPSDSVPLDGDTGLEVDEEVSIEQDDDNCNAKAEEGNRRLKAYFGRHRTHNDQLWIRTCGIILSRATFYGSEAVSAFVEFAKATFPSLESTPELAVYDSACVVDKFLRANNDTYFEKTAMPVDVFHFRSKHKDTDTHCNCQQYCNPASFPELYDENGKWIFNTSICEQTNVWYGGYIAIVRDMEVTRYNFFLDEMIKRRNRYTITQLGLKGHAPWTIPMEALFPGYYNSAK